MRTNVKLRLLSVLLAVVLCATMLTACGGSKLDGTYRSQGLISQSFHMYAQLYSLHRLKRKMPFPIADQIHSS